MPRDAGIPKVPPPQSERERDLVIETLFVGIALGVIVGAIIVYLIWTH